MNLNFQPDKSNFVAYSEVNNDFNVHLEFDEPTHLIVSQKTAGTAYAYVASFVSPTVDSDFDGIVWPKQIRIVASRMPKSAIITERS